MDSTAFSIIMLALTAIGILMSLLIYQLHKRDKRIERMVRGKVVEQKYVRSIGSLAHHTARSLIRNKLCNGEVSDAVKYYKECEHDFEDHQQETTILHDIK